MNYLLDTSATQVADCMERWPALVAGQLLTPLTQFAHTPGVPFAVDNGAYSQLNLPGLLALLDREQANRGHCLFVAVPDQVGSHQQTLAKWKEHAHQFRGWKRAFVLQDGFQLSDFPDNADVAFVGGSTQFKDTPSTFHMVNQLKAEGVPIHVGRVNTWERYSWWLGIADTCDGSGVSRLFSGKLERIARHLGARRRKGMW